MQFCLVIVENRMPRWISDFMGERITSELIHKKLEFTSTWDDWEPIEMACAIAMETEKHAGLEKWKDHRNDKIIVTSD